MSFLPYGDTTSVGWFGAFGTSAALHGGAVAALFALGSTQLSIAAEAPAPPSDFQVSVEELDADTLAGLLEQAGLAASDGLEETGPDPDTSDAEETSDTSNGESDPAVEAGGETGQEVLPLEVPEAPSLEEATTAETEIVEEAADVEALDPLESEAETLTPVTDPLETLAALPEPVEPDIVEPPLPEAEPELVPETVEPAAVEAVMVDPIPAAPVAAPVESLSPIANMATAPLASEALAPVSSDSVSVGNLEPTSSPIPSVAADVITVAPVLGDSTVSQGVSSETTSEPVAITADTLTTAQPVAPTQTAGLAPAPSTPAPAPAPPTEQDLAVRDLINQIRDVPAPSCLIALPRRDGEMGVGLAILASQDSAMEAFAQTALTAEDEDIRQTRGLVDPRQCPALNFVAETDAYPAVQIGIQVDQTSVPSGGTLTGAMRGVGGRFLTLVLVDDNGVVSDLQRFTATSGNIARFDVPVTRVGLARETRPLILAIVTDRPPTTLRARFGQLADDVFQDAVLAELGDVRIGIVAVDIR